MTERKHSNQTARVPERRVTHCVMLLLLALTLVVPATTFATEDTGEGGGFATSFTSSDELLEYLTERLELTEEQQTEAKPIIENHVKERDAIVAKYEDGGRRGMRQMGRELRPLSKKLEENLAPILTEEQATELPKAMAEKRSETRQGLRSTGSRKGA